MPLAYAQLKLLQNQVFPFIPLYEAIAILDLHERVINQRRYDSTTAELAHELRMCEIHRCNKILEEIT